MSAPATEAATSAPASAGRRRSVLAWTGIIVFLVVIGGIGAFVTQSMQTAQRGALDTEGHGPAGTRALAQILRDQGVRVHATDDREEALEALRSAGDATLVTRDAAFLSDDAFLELFDAATDVVLVDPASRSLELLFPGSAIVGFGGRDAVAPGCTLPDAERAGAVVVGAVFSAPEAARACYPHDDGYALLVGERGDGRVAAFDGAGIVTNEHLAEQGHAALALNLMGRHADLVWYLPTPADSDIEVDPSTLGEVTPAWVTPVLVTLALAAVAAAFWRGRRFGPLVVERLPVTVRAAETTQGRANLYARGRDHRHAADALRMGAVARLAPMLGLGSAAHVDEIADAAADRIGAGRDDVRRLLLHDVPTTDAQLMAVSDRLRDLERAVRAAVRDEGRTG